MVLAQLLSPSASKHKVTFTAVEIVEAFFSGVFKSSFFVIRICETIYKIGRFSYIVNYAFIDCINFNEIRSIFMLCGGWPF